MASSEPQHRSRRYVVIVLASSSGVNVERRHSTPIIACLKSKFKTLHFWQADVKSDATLYRAGNFGSIASVGAEVKQLATRMENSYSASEAEPRRDCEIGNKGYTGRGSDEIGTVFLRNLVGPIVQVFIRIEDDRNFHGQIPPVVASQPATVIDIEGCPVPKVHCV